MHVVVFSDIHLANWEEFMTIDPETGLNSRLIHGIQVLEQIRDYCVKHHIKAIFFGGDMFHSSKKLTPDMLEKAAEIIVDITQEHHIDMFMLPGQHDHFAQDGLINALRPFKFFYQLMDSVGAWEVDNKTQIISCPNRKDLDVQKENLKECRQYVKKGIKNIFMGHFLLKEIKEADGVNYDTNEVEYGDLPKGCDLYLLGDYHPHVWLPKLKVCSIGGTMHHTFSSKKRGQGGFLDLDLDKMTFKRIEIEAPMFMSLGQGEKITKELFDQKNFYEVVVEDQQEEDCIRAYLGEGWNVRYKPIEQEVAIDQENRMDVTIDMSPEEVVKKYCEYLDVDKEYVQRGLGYL